MSNTYSAHVVSARNPGAGGVVYFDGAGQWTTDLHQAQIARSAAGRKALLRVAVALANGGSVSEPNLTEISVPRAIALAAA
ncbi:MAG: DUF2849 domain-containing protein [Alphaproteobacteria bacterium]|nr:DUF2849 domain-containing protein [Alphaproteobacteria bacterium]